MATTTGPDASITDRIKGLSASVRGWWNKPYHGNESPGLIAHYWLAAGGNPAKVNEAVAASLAESSGNGGAVSPANDNGTHDVGLWQINSVHGPTMASTDPLTNARAAVHLSGNGSDWSAWCTSYDDGICHGSKANPHYRGAGKGNTRAGSAVLGQTELAILYGKDAIAGAYGGAQSAAGGATPSGVIPGNPGQIVSDIGDALGGGVVGKILAYAGYGLLAAFGASLMLTALAVLVLALVDRHPNLAAITPAGRLAGAASEAKAGASSRSARNQASGADAFRQTKAGRVAHGEKTSTPAGRKAPSAGGAGPRARRTHAGAGRMDDVPARSRRSGSGSGLSITDRMRASGGSHVSRSQTKAPF